MAIKICHVTSVHSTEDVRILKKECLSLAKKDNYLISLVGPGDSRIYNKVNIIGLGAIPSSRVKRMTEFAKKIVEKAIDLDADIYHLHDPELLRYALRFKSLGKKVIFDSHENVLDSIDDKVYMPVLLRKAFKIYYRIIQNRVFPKLNGIIVVSPQMIDQYEKYNDNLALVTNFPIVNKNESVNKTEPPVKGRFIFAGGITEQWSHREIINAMDKIDGVEYYLFGTADEGYLNELKKLNGWKKVHYGGKISFEAVQAELKKAQAVFALLKPSKNSFYMQGTLGNTKLFEAMENGKPVIATGFVLWKDVIESNECGVCVDLNKETSIEDAIRGVLRFPDEKIEKMGINGRKAISEKYNWLEAEKNLYNLYQKIV